MNTRSKIFASIGVLWLAAMLLVGFRLVDTAETSDTFTLHRKTGEETTYDWSAAAAGAGAATLATIVLAAGTIVWTRPEDDEQVAAMTPTARPAAREPRATPAQAPTVERPAPTDPDGAATIEASLRRLKALNDEGILTDNEYETKRKALTDQL